MSAPLPPLHVVLGAGPLGRATATALLAQGLRVRIVNRRGASRPPSGAEAVRADVLDATALAEATAGAAALYLCVQPPYHLWTEAFPPLQEAAVAAAARTGARLVAAENLYGYGPVAGPMTEDLPLAATTRKGRVRAAMSRRLMDLHRAGTVAVAIGRGSDFFGPGVTEAALGRDAFAALAAGRPVPVMGDPDLPHSYTYIPDFGRALAVLGTRDEALGRAWHVPSAPARTTREVLEIAAALAGRRLRLLRLRTWQVRALSLAVPKLRELNELSYQVTAPFIMDHGRFARAFGLGPTDLGEALAATLASLRPADGRPLRPDGAARSTPDASPA